MRKYYLVTTAHLEEALWFRDDQDFATGMNYVAIQAVLSPRVIVLVFILMSNHVHFVLYGTRAEVEAFVNFFKGRYSIYLSRKYGTKEFLRRNSLDIREISEKEVESLERVLAYVQVNCVAANICLYPGQYPWGTGSAFFKTGWERAGSPTVNLRRLGDLSGRERIRLLHSGDALKLPDDWLLSDAGFVLPESYVDVKRVESIFRNPRRMQYFLNSSSKARKRLEAEDENLPAFRDQVILGALPDLLQSLFQKPAFGALSTPEQAETLRQIRFRFSASVHQAARVCGISYADAARLLDTA
ncbi:MAG: hypothetical protein J6X99_06270 [Bacteroidales bacterium]|nr:hypothetical protein [Bacteroidales bacterium]